MKHQFMTRAIHYLARYKPAFRADSQIRYRDSPRSQALIKFVSFC